MREEIKLLNFLKSNKFILYVAIFTVIFLSPNTFFVFYSFSVFVSPYREIASVGVSAIIAASIMIYTLRKNYRMALYYSYFEISISAYYYIAMVVGFNWGLIPALSFTLILPLSVYYYSKEIEIYRDEPLREDVERWLENNPDKKPSDYPKEKR